MAPKLGVVLALRPRFAQLIYEGKKRVELRRAFAGSGMRIAFIYETAPVSAVTGFFLVKGSLSMTPESAWRRFDGTLGLDRNEFNNYVKGCDEVKILEIGKSARLTSPLPLRALTGRDSVPQSFCYISQTLPRSVGEKLREIGEASARWPGPSAQDSVSTGLMVVRQSDE